MEAAPACAVRSETSSETVPRKLDGLEGTFRRLTVDAVRDCSLISICLAARRWKKLCRRRAAASREIVAGRSRWARRREAMAEARRRAMGA